MRKTGEKLLAVLLAGAMLVLGVSAAFTDASGIQNQDAVSYLTEKNILTGYPDGTFRPERNVTRAEFSKMVFTMLHGVSAADGYKNTAPALSDISGHWANGFISALYNDGIVAGRGGGIFAPEGNVTGFEMAKMLLVATGTDADEAGLVGASWMVNTEEQAREKGFLAGYTLSLTMDATRDFAALMLYNAILQNDASSYKLCAVTAMTNSTVSILDEDGRKATYSYSDTTLLPSPGGIYYYKMDGSRLVLRKFTSIKAPNTTRTNGVQTYWSGDKVVTIDGEAYPTDSSTVVFVRHSRTGLPGDYTYAVNVYKASSLSSTFAGSVASEALLIKSGDKTVARMIVCDMDTYDITKRSASGVAYVTGDTFVSITGEKQYLVSFPMFAGFDKELYFVEDSMPTMPSYDGQFVVFQLNSQGRLKAAPTPTPVAALATSHAQNAFVVGEITAYSRSIEKVQIKALDGNKLFSFAENYKIVYLDTENTKGVSSGTVSNGNGSNNCVYYANANDEIVTLFVDVNGQIQ